MPATGLDVRGYREDAVANLEVFQLRTVATQRSFLAPMTEQIFELLRMSARLRLQPGNSCLPSLGSHSILRTYRAA